MSTESTRQFFQRYMDALQQGDKSPGLISRFVRDEALQDHIAMFEAAFPGYTLDAEDTIVSGDKAVLRGVFKGTHRGEFQGIAPTGREVSVPLMVIYRIEDNKIVEHWMNADLLSLMQQLGATPAPV